MGQSVTLHALGTDLAAKDDRDGMQSLFATRPQSIGDIALQIVERQPDHASRDAHETGGVDAGLDDGEVGFSQ
jgi:hypothetical protein